MMEEYKKITWISVIALVLGIFALSKCEDDRKEITSPEVLMQNISYSVETTSTTTSTTIYEDLDLSILETITTTTVKDIPEPTLEELIHKYFLEEDWEWAFRITFCESSAHKDDTYSNAIHITSNASGWFQHLPKFWEERSIKAGFEGYDILNPIANVGVASWLFYEGGGPRHWVCK
tara:strand:- start:2066 stop:2596 length:531 start_codon:yes stop_codon:yes gene_type:complete